MNGTSAWWAMTSTPAQPAMAAAAPMWSWWKWVSTSRRTSAGWWPAWSADGGAGRSSPRAAALFS